jgi:hypothetical protein
MVPLMKVILGMSHTPETAAHRYLQASEFRSDVSGHFFASAPKKFTGTIEATRQTGTKQPRYICNRGYAVSQSTGMIEATNNAAIE